MSFSGYRLGARIVLQSGSVHHNLSSRHDKNLCHRFFNLIHSASNAVFQILIVSDIFSLPLASPENEEGPALGAALQALWCVNGGDMQELASNSVKLDEQTRCRPDTKMASRYQDLYSVYLELAESLTNSPVFPAHRDLIQD